MSRVALQQINYFQAKQLPKVNNVTDNFWRYREKNKYYVEYIGLLFW